MRKIVVGMALTIGLAGCVNQNFVPGPGMSAIDLGPQAAQCRLMARGVKTGFGFAAAGSPKFVAASTGGAIVGYAIASAVEQNSNYNDCMEARGWRIADVQPVAMTTAVRVEQLPPPTATAATVNQPSVETKVLARQGLGVRAVDVTFVAGDARPPHGIMITAVDSAGAGSSAGLREGDVILNFNGLFISNVGDMQRALASLESAGTVVANVRRDGKERQVAIRL